MEFTIQEGKLYFLQTRNGKRTAPAALRIACELVDEGKITKEEAVSRIDAKALDQLLHPNFDQAALKAALPIGEALPASPGAAAGKVYFDAEMAKLHHEAGLKVILVRLETSPEDIEGMHAAEGILTARGGMTSHAAVVARGMGTACVAGCGDIKFAEDGKSFTLGGKTVQEGDYISLDGSTGKIYLGEIRTVPASISGNFDRIMTWADEIRTLQVRTNADTPADALNAVKFGAQGIGLCRTEHMFFDAERKMCIRDRAIIGAAMIKVLLTLLPMIGVLSTNGQTYQLLSVIGDGAFFFMPVLIAISASKKFGTNMYYAASIAPVSYTHLQDRLLHWMYTTMAGRASLKILIRPWVSKLGGAFLSSPISKCLIKGFVKNNHIDMSEYEKKNYKSYNEFFSRKIKEGKRPFPEDKTILGSPCDCKVSVYPIEEKTSFVVKDTRYTLDSLIRNRKIARHFQGGYAVILRLTVDDYHRYCYFDDGIKSENHRIDGVYHTVNPIANDHVKIYKENTREYPFSIPRLIDPAPS